VDRGERKGGKESRIQYAGVAGSIPGARFGNRLASQGTFQEFLIQTKISLQFATPEFCLLRIILDIVIVHGSLLSA
jgi:hypothetical protein